MGSHVITIKRARNRSRLPHDIMVTAKMKIGASMTTSGDVARDMTLDEEKSIMPGVIGISENDPHFVPKLKDYWNSLSVNIPVEGLRLETGVNETTNAPLDANDFAKWRFVKMNPTLALDKVAAEGNKRKLFYVHDQKKMDALRKQEVDWMKKAMASFVSVTNSKEKTTALVTVYGGKVVTMDSAQQETFLYDQMHADAKKFYDFANDSGLETRALIADALEKGALDKVGNSILYMDEEIGETEEHAIKYLNNKRNSATLLNIKSRLKAL